MTKTKVPQAHNLSPEAMQDLQIQQQYGEGLKTVKGKGKLKSGNAYTFPDVEKHLVHAEIFSGGFNPQTGEALSEPYVQKFEAREFERMTKEQAFAGMKVTILHGGSKDGVEEVDPADYLKPQIVSQPGAGLPLTLKAEDLNKLSIDELKAYHKDSHDPSVATPTTKKELVADLTERFAFLSDPANADAMKALEANRLKAAENAGVNAGSQANK
jgi:hypothetical protein